MKLRIVLKEIAVPAPGKKEKYDWKASESRSNIVNTIAGALRKKIVDTITMSELEPSAELPVDAAAVIEDLRQNLSEKFGKINLKTIKIKGVYNPKGYGSEGFGGAVYDGIDESIEMDIYYGYSQKDFEIYNEVKDFRKGTVPKKGAKWVKPESFQVELEKKKKPIGFSAERDWPKFTESKTVNEENVSNVGKLAARFITPQQVQQIYEKVRPETPENKNKIKRTNIEASFSKLSDKFLTLIHEARHAKQFASKKRLEQLASYLRWDSKGKSLAIPMMTDDKYQIRSREDRLYQPDAAPSMKTAFGKFTYYARPYEIDGRITELRRNIENLKSQGIKDAYAKAFEVSKKREEAFANTISITQISVDTDKIATEELREKYLYQFYYQLSLDAKAIFASDPRYKEELEKHKTNVEAINQQIQMLITAKTVNPADDKQKEMYAYWITLYDRNKKEETGQPEQTP
jgi:hypothetical protein